MSLLDNFMRFEGAGHLRREPGIDVSRDVGFWLLVSGCCMLIPILVWVAMLVFLRL